MLFIQSAIKVNHLCEEPFVPDDCYVKDTIIYIILLCISLIEGKCLRHQSFEYL